jgi:hypothetical protein
MNICEVCNSEFGNISLDLGFHPLCDDLVPVDSELSPGVYQQLISLCEVCLTAHQMVPVMKEKLFKYNYHYRAALTSDVIKGMTNLAEETFQYFDTKDKKLTIVDIGCNDGSLLGIFKDKYSCTTIGVDPTGAILESGNKIDFKFNDYFAQSTAKEIKKICNEIDLITFTNVFAHIENLPDLIANLKILISESTILVIENHYLGSILKDKQFDTFYHEHPRTYSLRSFEFIAKKIGLEITDVKFPSRYGGNIRVTMSNNKAKIDLSNLRKSEDKFINMFRLLQNQFIDWKFRSKTILNSLLEKGPVYGKALPGRAVMLINSLELSASEMPLIFEKPNSPKISNYVPGSKIKIVSDNELLTVNPETLIVWSWHITDEIIKYLQSLGYEGDIWVPLPEFKKIISKNG